ncbi:MAG: T9SS type A sorting domain-containing protein [Saprospiraceae bacterium]|nr:T9SS type A sorting domain-containing protein [Saprospiraceae bacterium]
MKKHLSTFAIAVIFCIMATSLPGQNIVMETLNGPTRSAVAVAFAHDANGKIFISYNNNIYTSTNNGSTWELCVNGLNGLGLVNKSTISKDGTIYIIVNGKLYRYDAATNSWFNRNWPLFDSNYNISTDASNKLWAVKNSNFQGIIYYSENHGDTWTPVNLGIQLGSSVNFLGTYNDDVNYLYTNSGLRRFKISGETSLIGSSFESYYSLVINPYTGDLFHVDYTKVDRLTGNSNTWQNVYSNLQPINTLNSMNILENGKMWFHGNKRTISSQNNGLTWEDNLKFSKYAGNFHCVNDTSWYQYGAPNAAFNYSKDGGNTWTDVVSDIFSPTVTDILSDFADNIYAKTVRRGSYEYSTDDGQTWDMYYITANNDQLIIKSLNINKNGILVAIAENNAVFRSVDNGTSWQQVLNLAEIHPSTNYSRVMAGNSHVMYIYSRGSSYKLWISQDEGLTWQSTNPPDMFNSIHNYPGHVNIDGNLYYPGGDLYLYNKNQNTTTKIKDLETYQEYISIQTTNNGKIYALYRDYQNFKVGLHVFTNTNGNLSLSTINLSNNPNGVITSDAQGNAYCLNNNLIKIDADNYLQQMIYSTVNGIPITGDVMKVLHDQRLYLCYPENLIKRTLNPLVATHPTPSTPYQINAYPNPFDQTINFEVSGDNLPEQYTIRICDVLGKCVKQQDFTGKSCTLNSLKLTPGIYFYHISAEGKNIGAGKIQAE